MGAVHKHSRFLPYFKALHSSYCKRFTTCKTLNTWKATCSSMLHTRQCLHSSIPRQYDRTNSTIVHYELPDIATSKLSSWHLPRAYKIDCVLHALISPSPDEILKLRFEQGTYLIAPIPMSRWWLRSHCSLARPFREVYYYPLRI